MIKTTLILLIAGKSKRFAGKIQVRKTKRRRNYYICENNPKSCDYISWNKPKVGEKVEETENKSDEKKTKKKTKK